VVNIVYTGSKGINQI